VKRIDRQRKKQVVVKSKMNLHRDVNPRDRPSDEQIQNHLLEEAFQDLGDISSASSPQPSKQPCMYADL
jgi:hypothetical protein